ncbi:unnamed protein product [Trichogramma brassicae]|uniref:NAD-dependent epimerase/dehydratase domain-containing protein n=1 Tax=Trichogramma brassicae TaxID=86971 RepID=A0A6H5IQX6_9HYME|nr:unnamed protein product [Trichogramma brassicae]
MANNDASNDKPSVIVLGGCGFIGRNLVEYLIENELVSYLRVVDKVPPQMAWLNKKHQTIFDHPLIEFCMSCQNAFTADHPINYVINCAGETKTGQTDPVYREGIYKLSINCAQQAATIGAEHYIELSAGNFTKYKLQVENELKNIPGLKYTILRPAIVYGPGDKTGLAPRLVIGAVYKHLGEMMKLLWGPDLKMNTVHVRDLARAIWLGTISSIISELFNINHDYMGVTLSFLAKMDMTTIAEEINDKHMGPWAEACNIDGIQNSPLTPYIDQEILYNRSVGLSLQPAKLLQDIHFQYNYPKLTKEALKEVSYSLDSGIFSCSVLTNFFIFDRYWMIMLI